MKKNSRQHSVKAFEWRSSARELRILDQLKLPFQEKWISCRNHGQIAECIRKMNVRGAPAIGCVAAFGVVLAAWEKNFTKMAECLSFIYSAAQNLSSTRPTAVNLFWALERMKCVIRKAQAHGKNERDKIKKVREALEAEAIQIFEEDLAGNFRMGDLGAQLLEPGSVVLTHCNTGSLATSGWGTALGVIRSGHEKGKIKKVLVDETRPYLQGSRLTAWELAKDNIPFELITDNMAAHMFKTEKVSAVFVGADRIAASGDVANKIGTYGLAVLAHYHRVPFYVVAPTTTIDMEMLLGSQIPIEERSPKEVTHLRAIPIAPEGIRARHPAFDVTPAALITAIITEKGIARQPLKQSVSDFFAEARSAKERAAASAALSYI